MAIHEVHVKRKPNVNDPRGEDVAAEAARTLGITTLVRTTNVFRVEGPSLPETTILSQKAFVDPIVEIGEIDPDTKISSNPVIEVAYRPQVSEPVSETIHKVAHDLKIPLDAARLAIQYEFEGINQDQAGQIVKRLLVNESVQEIITRKPETLKIKGERKTVATIPLLDATDTQLDEISQQRKLHLNTDEMRAAQKEARRLKRNLTDVEIELLAARWSDHCVHKTFNARVITPEGEKDPLFTRIKNTSRKHFKGLVATAFVDNSGGMFFYDGTVVLVKWETHNSPSALDPIGGAATGSGGVFRDIMATGRDGIHGAAISSSGRTEQSAKADKEHVQIGNPIEKKKIGDAILEARDKDLIRTLTDCGAAGFSSAIGEIAENVWVNVDISKAPLKYEGLSPWEIWVSESQERMILAIDPNNMEEFLNVCKRHNVEATDLGIFDGNNKLTVRYGDEVVADLDYDFLKNGLPQKEMPAEFKREIFEEPEIDIPSDWVATLKAVLSHGNVCSKLPIVEQYDTTVQGTNALAPFGGVNLDAPNDAVVIRPILDKPYGLVISHGMNPILNRINPERGAKWAATEGVANLVAVGGNFREMGLCGK